MKLSGALFMCMLSLGGSYVCAQKAQHPLPGGNSGQTPLIQLGDNFLGDWEWSDNGEVFHITITRNTHWPVPESPTHQTANVILGTFRYTRNGTVIAESVPATVSGVNALHRSFVERQKMEMNFYDYTNRKSGQIVLTFLPNSTDQITWSLQPVEESHYNNTTPPDFSVPTDVTLTRQ